MSFTNNFTTAWVSTQNTDLRTVRDTELITDEQALYIMRILLYGITPGISVLGIIGNIFSMIILLKQGLQKCSNILLTSLAVADLLYLIFYNSVPRILYEVVGIQFAFQYERSLSFALFVMYGIVNMLHYAASSVSLTMPMLITFERLVAVFIPFRFNLIITPVRTWCAVAIVYIFWFSFFTYMIFWFTFDYVYDNAHNISIGVMKRSELYHDTYHSTQILEQLGAALCMKVPPVVTSVGCLAISVKVKMASSQRKKIATTNGKRSSSNRTTKMMLAVCVVYLLACAVVSIPSYIPQYLHYTVFSDAPSNLGRVVYQAQSIGLCINSSANFVIYVGMNKNFRDTYKSLFVDCCKRRIKRSAGSK